MRQCGERVFYGSHGVCRIIDIEMRKIDRKMIEYYVLEPLEQTGARFYIPTQNEAAVAKLRPIMTQDELDALLNILRINWISNLSLKKQETVSYGLLAL